MQKQVKSGKTQQIKRLYNFLTYMIRILLDPQLIMFKFVTQAKSNNS
jgi:hypothetical protein